MHDSYPQVSNDKIAPKPTPNHNDHADLFHQSVVTMPAGRIDAVGILVCDVGI